MPVHAQKAQPPGNPEQQEPDLLALTRPMGNRVHGWDSIKTLNVHSLLGLSALGWDSIKHVNVYSLMGLSALKM